MKEKEVVDDFDIPMDEEEPGTENLKKVNEDMGQNRGTIRMQETRSMMSKGFSPKTPQKRDSDLERKLRSPEIRVHMEKHKTIPQSFAKNVQELSMLGIKNYESLILNQSDLSSLNSSAMPKNIPYQT